MKKNSKIKSLIIVSIIAILLTMTTVVFATDTNYTVGMSLTSSSKLKEGDNVTVQVNLTSINAGEGIDTITAELNYDETVFETLTSADITSSNEWTPSFASSTKMITIQKNSKVTAPETVVTITLKVKSTINVDSTTVELKDIIVSGGRVVDGGTGDIEVNNSSVTISKEQAPITPVTPTKPTNSADSGNSTENKNTSIKDNTVTPSKTLPKTGIEQYGVIAIIIVAIVAIFSYALYKKIAKDVK